MKDVIFRDHQELKVIAAERVYELKNIIKKLISSHNNFEESKEYRNLRQLLMLNKKLSGLVEKQD